MGRSPAILRCSNLPHNHSGQAVQIADQAHLPEMILKQSGDGFPLVIADFQAEPAAVMQMPGRFMDDAAIKIQAVHAGKEGHIGLLLHFRLQCSPERIGNIGGIADDEIKFFPSKRRKQIPLQEADIRLQAFRIFMGQGKGVAAQIRGGDDAAGAQLFDGDGQGAGAGA